MSRRKQSNPKSLKSEIDSSTESAGLEDSKDSDMDEVADNLSEGWEAESKHSPNGQSEFTESVTSSDNSVVVKETKLNLKLESGELSSSSSSSKESVSPVMGTPERSSSGRPPSAPPSALDASKIIASSSYLTAALKASIVSTSALACVVPKGELPSSQGSFSPPDSPPSASPSKTPSSKHQTHTSAIAKSSGLPEISVASSLSLLKTADSTGASLSSMIQGLPLLSSVLPALQRLAPGSLSSLQPVASGSGVGIVCVCGVKFNSTSNLEAHRLFYCSHRQVNPDGRGDRKEGSPSRETEEESPSPTGRLLKCPHCAYTTTHKLSLNGHMNIHTNPDDAASQASKSTFSTAGNSAATSTDPRAQERYCADCDIQFSSMKTYRVHKAHYCQTRHVLKGAKSPAREEPTPHVSLAGLGGSVGPSGQGGPQPILALPTNPVILLPYSMVAGAQLLPPHILPQLGAAFVLPNGQVHPIPSASPQHSSTSGASIPPLLSPGALAVATAAIISASTNQSSCTLSPSMAKSGGDASPSSSSSSFRSKSPREEESRGGKRRGDGECPLDLTTKRPKLAIKTDLLNDEEKENRETLNSESPLFKPSFGGGEFEGKLLASPPRLSPGEEDVSGPKSPRPLSAATPRISSPRRHLESPRPSTSAMSTSSRSPGHTSPVAATAGPQSLTALTSGFPSSLVNSLESLGGASLPLASLQCLQSLQNVPRELALKLISPELLMNGLPPPVLNPPVIVKQGEAKCNECNIVFYKEESLQIHKKHYCSARDTKKNSDDDGARSPPTLDASNGAASGNSTSGPLRSPVRDTPSSSSLNPAQEGQPQKPSKTLLQFICSACGIKFSSPDNLTAHQTYYCPKREGAPEEGVAKGVWRCPRCRIVMAETMQAAHQCVSPSPAPSHGWKCPCCPVLSPTAAAAQKHLETHAGIKAFRCTICGYRGNTLRGMRTHIRMHFEKRTNDLQEENFIACILEEEEQSRGRGGSSAESRKLMQSTRLILENTALSALLGETPSDQGDAPLSCAYCPFITSVRSTLLQHLTLVHKVGLETSLQEIKNLFNAKLIPDGAIASSSKKESKREVENGAREAEREPSPPIPSIKLEPEVKLEVQDVDEEEATQSTPAEDDPPKSPSTKLSHGSPSNERR